MSWLLMEKLPRHQQSVRSCEGCCVDRLNSPGKTCRDRLSQARQFVTLSVSSPPPNDALRKVYSITSSARSWIAVDSSTPIALAVLRLMTNSNFTACSTGRSAGFVPLSILPV
jgi:hypothetical protein